jgi:DNA-directed RNA polymerase specialized sigma24 family protein
VATSAIKSRKELFRRSPTGRRIPRRLADLEQEELIADSVGLALMVILEKLTPADRVAFVPHDVFDVPFEEIAPIVGERPRGKECRNGYCTVQSISAT